MAKEDKTEKPSARTLRKAYERGNIPYSAELSWAVLFGGSLILLWGLKGLFRKRLLMTFQTAFTGMNGLDVLRALKIVFYPVLLPLCITLAGCFIIAIAAHWMQTGIIIKKETGKRKKEPVRIGFLLLKTALLFFIGFFFLFWKRPSMPLFFSSPSNVMKSIFSYSFLFLIIMAGIFLFLGIADFFYQKWKFRKELYMTRQEAKEERREEEGDAQVKSRRWKRDK